MATGTAQVSTETKSVGMGQITVARAPARLGAVLGSCIGLILHHQRLQLGGLAHVVLPDSGGRPANPGKFVDTAVPRLLEMFKRHGALPAGLVAKITGGACMFGSKGPIQIGEANIRAITQMLAKAGIRIAAKHTGRDCGRRISFDCRSGKVTVETVGNPPVFL